MNNACDIISFQTSDRTMARSPHSCDGVDGESAVGEDALFEAPQNYLSNRYATFGEGYVVTHIRSQFVQY